MTVSHIKSILVLTILESELNAVLSKLRNVTQETTLGQRRIIYYRGSLPSRGPQPHIINVVRLSKMGNIESALVTQNLIVDLKPSYIFVVGIAGGIPDNKVKITDVVIADQAIYYELAKIIGNDYEFRYFSHPTSRHLYDFSLAAVAKYKKITENFPAVHFGPIASGDKVIASDKFRGELLKHYPKLLAVEMESAGVGQAILSTSEPVSFLAVRGISDLANPKKHGKYQLRAAEAAALVFSKILIELPDTSRRSLSSQDIKTISKLEHCVPAHIHPLFAGLVLFDGAIFFSSFAQYVDAKLSFKKGKKILNQLSTMGLIVFRHNRICMSKNYAYAWTSWYETMSDSATAAIIGYLSRSTDQREVKAQLEYAISIQNIVMIDTILEKSSQMLLICGHYEILKEACKLSQNVKPTLIKLIEARVQEHSGHYDVAEVIYRQTLRSRVADVKLVSCYGLANCSLSKGDIRKANTYIGQIEQLGLIPLIEGHYYHLRGYLLWRCHSNKEEFKSVSRSAIDFFRKSLMIFQDEWDVERVADTLYHLADLNFYLEEIKTTLNYLEQCIALSVEYDLKRIRANALMLKGYIGIYKKDLKIMKTSFDSANKIYTGLGDNHKRLVSQALLLATSLISHDKLNRRKQIITILNQLKSAPTTMYYDRAIQRLNEISAKYQINDFGW